LPKATPKAGASMRRGRATFGEEEKIKRRRRDKLGGGAD
jgi:hypothetical protein